MAAAAGSLRRSLRQLDDEARSRLLSVLDKQTSMIYLLIFQSSPTHGADYGGLMAAATLTSLPVVLLFLLFQRRIATGLTAGAVKG